MINPLNELSGVYLAKIAEQEADNTPEDVKTRVMQIVKAIRYKARKEGGNIVKAFNDYMGGQSGIGAAERQMVKQRLGLQEEVGISSSAAIEKAKKEAALRKKEAEAVEKAKKVKEENEVVDEYIDTVKKVKKAELDQDLKRWGVEEDYETKKKGEVLKALDKKKFVKRYGKDKAPDVMYAVAAKTAKQKGDTSKSDDRYAYEGFSNWREDLREIADNIPTTDKKMEVKIKEKVVNNKIEINPVLGGTGREMGEEIKKIGGELIEMTEVEEQVAAGGAVPLSPQEVMIAKRQAMLQTRASKQRQRTLAKVKGEKPGEEVKEEKKTLPKVKMYRKAANLARKGDPESMKKQTKIVSVLNKSTTQGYKDAALAKLRDGGSPKHQVSEKLDYDPMDDPDFDPREAEKKRGVSGKNNPKGGKKLKDIVKESGWHRRNPEKVGTPADPDYRVLKGSGKVTDIKDSKPSTTGKASKKPPGIYKPNKEGKFVKVEERGFNFIKQFMKEKATPASDKAYLTTVAKLKAKYPGGVLASKKDFEDHKKREAAKPKPKPKAQKPLTDKEKAQREVDAQYGRTPWNPRGSLGT